MDIPSRYLREMAAGEPWQRALAADMLNRHSIHTPRARVLLRTVGAQVRGVLSDSYRRIDSQSTLIAFLEEAKRQGAVICDAYMSDTKVWAETILPAPLTIPTAKNGHVVIFMGARFSTSDYGDGALDMRAFLLNGVCLNGMVRESVWKQIHLGAKLPGNLRLSDRTYELDTQATVSAVRDLARQLYSRETIRKKAVEIQRASETDVDFTAELQRLVKNNRLLKNESEQVEQLLMQNRPEDGLSGRSHAVEADAGADGFRPGYGTDSQPGNAGTLRRAVQKDRLNGNDTHRGRTTKNRPPSFIHLFIPYSL